MKKYKRCLLLFSFVLSFIFPCTVQAYDLQAPHEVNLYYTNPEEIAKIQKLLWGEFRSWGMTEAGCAGVLGNMMAESGCDYTRTQSNTSWENCRVYPPETSSNTGLGLTQWTYWSRQEQLFTTADSLGKQWNDLEVQATQLKSELGEGGSYYIEELYTSNDLNTCSDLFLARYENPAVYNTSARRELSQAVFDALKGTEAKSLIGNNTNDTEVDVSEQQYQAIVNEWELLGMPSRSDLSKNQKEISLKSRSDLSISENYSVQKIKDDIEIANKAITYDNARVAVVFAGLCMVFYSVLMLLAFMFDRTNQFIEISLIKVLSFGCLEYSDDDTTKGETGYASTGRVLTIIVVMCIIGLLLVSGGVLPYLMKLAYSIFEKYM